MKTIFCTLCSVSLAIAVHAGQGEEFSGETSRGLIPARISSINGPTEYANNDFRSKLAMFQTMGDNTRQSTLDPKAKKIGPPALPKPKSLTRVRAEDSATTNTLPLLKKEQPKPAPRASKGETLPRTSVGALKIVDNARRDCPQGPLVPEALGRQASMNIFPPLSLIPDTTPKEATEAIVARATRPALRPKPSALHPTVQTPYLQGSLPVSNRLSRIEDTVRSQTQEVPLTTHAETMTELSDANSLEQIMKAIDRLTEGLGKISLDASQSENQSEGAPLPPSPAPSTSNGSGIEIIDLAQQANLTRIPQQASVSVQNDFTIISYPSSSASKRPSLGSSDSRPESPIFFGPRTQSTETVGEAEAQKKEAQQFETKKSVKKKHSWLPSCLRGS